MYIEILQKMRDEDFNWSSKRILSIVSSSVIAIKRKMKFNDICLNFRRENTIKHSAFPINPTNMSAIGIIASNASF